MPFPIPDVAPGVTIVIALRELEILAGRELNDVILVTVYYWMESSAEMPCICARCYGTVGEREYSERDSLWVILFHWWWGGREILRTRQMNRDQGTSVMPLGAG